jgi:hypothetical protein
VQILPSRWRHAWLPSAWCFGAILIVYASTRGSFDPAARQYGANWPGDVPRALTQLTIEVGILYVLLRPRSYVASWKRSLTAFLIFAVRVVLGGIMSVHTGRVYGYHWLWLILVTVGLFAAWIISASVAASISNRLPNER